MKQIFQLDDHDLRQLMQGHIYDIVLNGVSYGLAYRGTKILRGPYKAKPPLEMPKKRPTKRQASARFVKFFTHRGNGVQCRQCQMTFRGIHQRVGGMTHFRRMHPELWKKEKRA